MKAAKLLAALSLVALSASAFASSGGVISFSGRIVESPCQASISQQVGKEAAQVQVKSCKAPYQIQASAHGEKIGAASHSEIGKPMLMKVNLAGKNVQFGQVMISYL